MLLDLVSKKFDLLLKISLYLLILYPFHLTVIA